MSVCMLVMMVSFFNCSANVICRQQREYICLKEGNQQFETCHEYSEGDGNHRYAESGAGAHLTKNENETEEGKSNNVTRGDVCKQSDHKDEGTKEQSQNFDRCKEY